MKLPALQRQGRTEVVAFSPCGRFLFVSAGEHGWVFDWPRRRLLHQARLHPIFDAVFKEDGMLAVCGARTVTMFGLPRLVKHPSAKHVAPSGVPDAAWLYGDRLVTAGYNTRKALLLDFMGTKLASLPTRGDMVWSVATSEAHIAAASDGISIWDEATLEPLGTTGFPPVETETPALRFLPNGKRVPTNTPAIFGLGFTPSGEALVSAGSDGQVCLWDPATLALREHVHAPGLDPRNLRMLTETTGWMTAADGLYRVTLDPLDVRVAVSWSRRHFRWYTPIGLDVSADGAVLGFGGLFGAIGRWDLEADRLLHG